MVKELPGLIRVMLLVGLVSAKELPARRIELTAAEAYRCHRPRNRRSARDCLAYERTMPEWMTTSWPTLADACLNVTWSSTNAALGNASTLGTGAWGSCVATAEDDSYRYVVSNSVPAHYFPPYCPLGLGLGYCVGDEACVFDGLICGDETSVGSSAGYTPLGDVWVPALAFYAMPLVGDPTRSGLPASMYDTVGPYGYKDLGPATGVTIQDGISIQGPNDAGNYNIDEAGFILPCGGHVTPPTDVGDDDMDSPPLFHYHQAANCLDAFVDGNKPVSHGGTGALSHGTLFAYAMDGFGIYTFSDNEGAAPVLDECGGHFGATPNASTPVYHYHATVTTPYHLACQGPALGNCQGTQMGVDFCGAGCDAQLCIQPGTNLTELKAYLASFGNASWFDAYTNNLAATSSLDDAAAAAADLATRSQPRGGHLASASW